MERFNRLEGVAAPLPLVNVDTDMIIPKQFLKSPRRTGYAGTLFHEMRFEPDGRERPEFILNQGVYREARILVAGANFGCGSCREHASWAIAQFGIRCLIAPSFADIFESNCANNGILTVALDEATVDYITSTIDDPATARMWVDLERCELGLATGEVIAFEVGPYRRRNLLDGLDAIGATLALSSQIAEFEQRHWQSSPWLMKTARAN
jgi:3-isopropylmalate/(R)-2-methylmalate dehydratase small subunit